MCLDTDRLFLGLDLAPGRSLTVAISGGSDSLSLLLLLKTHLDAHAPHVPLLAVTVDHGLRREAADEACAVAALCAVRGIQHRTMVWRGDKPATGVSAASREARYELLAQAATDFGSDCILTGHTMDDQAETVAMRRQRGAGLGLSGMAAATLFDERVWIVRPLLNIRRAQLRSWLQAQNVAWIDDPSNASSKYERVRVRAALDDKAIEDFAQQANAAARSRASLSDAAADLIERWVTYPVPGLFRLQRSFFQDDEATAVHGFRVLLACAGGASYLPELTRAEGIFRTVLSGSARVSLSRTTVDSRRDAVWLRREARGLPSVEVRHKEVLWDGRWRIAGDPSDGVIRVSACGHRHVADIECDAAGVPRSLFRAALASEPAVFAGDDPDSPASLLQGAPWGLKARRAAGPYARYLPDFDFKVAAVLSGLIGNFSLPASPWKHHIEQ